MTIGKREHRHNCLVASDVIFLFLPLCQLAWKEPKNQKSQKEKGANAHFQPNLFNLNGEKKMMKKDGAVGMRKKTVIIETRRHEGISDMIEAGGGGCLIA